MDVSFCQRWRRGRANYRPARDVFDPHAFEVAEFSDDATAKAFVAEHHYAETTPPIERRFALHARGGAMVGVALFTTPMKYAVLRPWRKGEATELGRLVLLDGVLANAESWFVRRCLDVLARDGLAGVVSHSDPEPREDVDGNVTFVGHFGLVYQACGAVYTGRASKKTQYLLPDGREFSNRAASKIRKGEVGVRYAVEQLVADGARPPRDGEDLRAWLNSERQRITRRRQHRGNFRYVFPITRGARRDVGEGVPYPKVHLHRCVGGPRLTYECAPTRAAA